MNSKEWPQKRAPLREQPQPRLEIPTYPDAPVTQDRKEPKPEMGDITPRDDSGEDSSGYIDYGEA
jgi:hypothetical protein